MSEKVTIDIDAQTFAEIMAVLKRIATALESMESMTVNQNIQHKVGPPKMVPSGVESDERFVRHKSKKDRS